ncbi:uncharacterized protein LOC103312787 [Tribolium castaneum]|nr:PREDICTED: uncharacterized protein LOC103312787 [Tribolium castaneum]|eukprot:XP_008192496.2 PREDICTED: uncharacterized protein LOC103312787 [Tribolium castaneum]
MPFCINTRVKLSINQTSNRITMNFLALIVPFAMVLATSASIIGSGAVLQGPAAEATIAGPDGSAIAAAAQAGTVVAAPRIGGVVSEIITPGLVTAAAPVLAPAGAVIAGPSGTVISNAGLRTIIAGPALGLI